MQVFSEASLERFEENMLAHLNRFFPQQCADLSPQQLKDTVQYGIKRASWYGITTERDIYKFIDVILLLGPDFDRKVPWAVEILKSDKTPSTRMWLLVRKTEEHLKQV